MEKKINAAVRSEKGKNASGRLRTAGTVPGNLLVAGKSIPLTFSDSAFQKLLNSGIRQSTLIDLEIEGAESAHKSNRVLIKEIQRHPVSGKVLHVDFFKAEPGKRVQVKVAVEITGISKGVKAGGALEHYVRHIKIRALPETLVDSLQVDITDLDVGQVIHLSQVKIPAEWEVRMIADPLICRIAQSRLTQTEGKAS